MNTYSNRSRRNPWHGVKPARNVTPDEAEAGRMAIQILELCDRRFFEGFVTMRQEDASIEALREYHHLVTAPAIGHIEALEAAYREDATDLLDYSRGQF